MKIAIVTLGIYPLRTGGVELHSYYHVSRLAADGHQVEVYTKRYSAPTGRQQVGNTEIHVFGSPLPFFGQLFFVLKTLVALLKRRRDLDVVHVHYATYFVLPAYLLNLLARKPFVVSCHGYDIEFLGRSRLWRSIQRIWFARASMLTATSLGVRRILVSAYHVAPWRIEHVPNGVEVDASLAGRRATDNTIVIVANLRPVKDPLCALEAFRIVHQGIPDSRMVFVGDGPMRSEVERFVRTNSLADCVVLTGLLPHPRTIDIVSRSRIFVLSSLKEGGNPLALMEAMALGKPVVATGVGGVKDAIQDGVNGILVPPRSPASLAKAIERVMNDEGLASRISREALRTSIDFSWESVISRYEALYVKVVRP